MKAKPIHDDKLTPEDNKRLTEFMNELCKKVTQQQKDFDQLWIDRPDMEPYRSTALQWFKVGYDLAEQRARQKSK